MKDIILHIHSYPEPTSVEAIDQAVRFAAVNDANLTALAIQVDIKAPGNWLADRLFHLSGLYAQEEAKSKTHSQSAIAAFTEKLAAYDVKGDASFTKIDPALMGQYVAYRARTHDLCLIAVTDLLDGRREVAEAVVFQSGRPVLLYRPGDADLPSRKLSIVVIAWDGSRTAARAMADALPMLRKSTQVRVLTVVNEKPDAQAGLGDEAVRHLMLHDIEAVADEVDAAGRHIGLVLSDYVAVQHADLLVMGAYGRSKMREFFLGGATEHMLRHSPVPLLLSH